MASAKPCDIRNCAASAAHAISIADPMIDGNVQRAEIAETPGVIVSTAAPNATNNFFKTTPVLLANERRGFITH